MFDLHNEGPRACLGRRCVTIRQSGGHESVSDHDYFGRFAETEGLAVLSLMILRYKVTVTEEVQFAGESFEQRKERILATRGGLTLT